MTRFLFSSVYACFVESSRIGEVLVRDLLHLGIQRFAEICIFTLLQSESCWSNRIVAMVFGLCLHFPVAAELSTYCNRCECEGH